MRYNVRKALKSEGLFWDGERGATLIETLVALALLGIIACVLVGSVGTSAKATLIADERTTAESLARSQTEYVKSLGYVTGATQYTAMPVPSNDDYTAYSATIDAEPLHDPEDGIQKITVTITHRGKEVFASESYKVDR